MSLVEQYEQQQGWRDWPRFLDRLPLAPGQLVWDIGCGTGEVTRLLAERGADVVAIDADAEMLAAARRRNPRGVEFQQRNLLADRPAGSHPIDGIWFGFSLAYFVDAAAAIRRWTSDLQRLAPGAWIAALEIDHMFSGHSPLDDDIRAELIDFEQGMQRDGLYDFCMGSKVPQLLEALGFDVVCCEHPPDPELHFAGPANEPVVQAWTQRLARMKGMQQRLGARFAPIRDAFVQCLQQPKHETHRTLWFVLGTRRGAGPVE